MEYHGALIHDVISTPLLAIQNPPNSREKSTRKERVYDRLWATIESLGWSRKWFCVQGSYLWSDERMERVWRGFRRRRQVGGYRAGELVVLICRDYGFVFHWSDFDAASVAQRRTAHQAVSSAYLAKRREYAKLRSQFSEAAPLPCRPDDVLPPAGTDPLSRSVRTSDNSLPP